MLWLATLSIEGLGHPSPAHETSLLSAMELRPPVREGLPVLLEVLGTALICTVGLRPQALPPDPPAGDLRRRLGTSLICMVDYDCITAWKMATSVLTLISTLGLRRGGLQDEVTLNLAVGTSLISYTWNSP